MLALLALLALSSVLCRIINFSKELGKNLVIFSHVLLILRHSSAEVLKGLKVLKSPLPRLAYPQRIPPCIRCQD